MYNTGLPGPDLKQYRLWKCKHAPWHSFNYFESGAQAISMLYMSYDTKSTVLQSAAVTENPQKQYQALQVRMDHIRQIAKQNMLYSRDTQHRARGPNVAC